MLLINPVDANINTERTKSLIVDLTNALQLFKDYCTDPETVVKAIVNADKGIMTNSNDINVELKTTFTNIQVGLLGVSTRNTALTKGADKLKYLIRTILEQIKGFTSVNEIVKLQVTVAEDNFRNVSENLDITELKERKNMYMASLPNQEWFYNRVRKAINSEDETVSNNSLSEYSSLTTEPEGLVEFIKNTLLEDKDNMLEAMNDTDHSFANFLNLYNDKVKMVTNQYLDKESSLDEKDLIQPPVEQVIEIVPLKDTIEGKSITVENSNYESFVKIIDITISILGEHLKANAVEFDKLNKALKFELPSDKFDLEMLANTVDDVIMGYNNSNLTVDELKTKLNNVIFTCTNLFTLDQHLIDVSVHKLNVINASLNTYEMCYNLLLEITDLGVIMSGKKPITDTPVVIPTEPTEGEDPIVEE